MKIRIFTLVLFLAVSSFAVAQRKQQSPKSNDERAEMITAKMDKRLQFSPEQRKQAQAINLTAATEMEALRQSGLQQGTPEFKEKRTAIETKRKNGIEAILTAEQKAKVEAMKAKKQTRKK